jgi:EmrB/QacA subfamily drug resistance transporter
MASENTTLTPGTEAPQHGGLVAEDKQPIRGKQLAVVISGLLLGMLLAALDQTIVGTAMPTIFRELGGSIQNYSWVVTAYLLTSTITVPIYGKLSDLWGRKWFFMGGIILFLAGSALSGASQNITQLILFRGIQGLGAGAIMPIAFAIIGDLFTPAERGKWQGLFSGVFGLASIVGPLLGGYITDNISWRWIFYINLPLGAVALVVLFLTLPVFRNAQASRQIDYIGTALLVIGITPLLLGFSLVGTGPGQYAWDSVQIIVSFSIAAVGILAFIFWELFGTKAPVLDLRLFKNSIFTVSILVTIMLGAAMFGSIVYIPLFLQGVTGVSATNSGSLLIPLMAGWVVASIISGQLLSRTGRYHILALVGLALAIGGMFLMSRMDASTGELVVFRNMVILGLGMGTGIALFTIIVQNAFPIQKIGVVTAALTFFRQIASTVGTAVFGSLLTNQFTNAFTGNLHTQVSQLQLKYPQVPQTQWDALQQKFQQFANPNLLTAPGAQQQIQNSISHQIVQQATQGKPLPPPAIAQITQQANAFAHDLVTHLFTALKLSLVGGIQEVFIVATILLAAAFVVCIFLKEIPLRKVGGAAGMASLGEGGAPEGGQETPSAAELIERELEGLGAPVSADGLESKEAGQERKRAEESVGPPAGD